MYGVNFRSQIITPSKIICVGRNYLAHTKELNNPLPAEPVLFIKPNSAIASNLRSIIDCELHYEGEIALLIENNTISGVGFGIDITKRDLQTQLKTKGLPWERAKAFNGSAVFSNFVEFTDDPLNLSLEFVQNDKIVQQGNCQQMLFKPSILLQAISKDFELINGDIIMTGTPEGVGVIHQADRFKGRIYNKKRLLVEYEWQVK